MKKEMALMILLSSVTLTGCKTMDAITSDLKTFSDKIGDINRVYMVDTTHPSDLTVIKLYAKDLQPVEQETARRVSAQNAGCPNFTISKSVLKEDRNDNITKWVIVGKCS